MRSSPLPSSPGSPQMGPKPGFWFGMLGTEWWETYLQANMCKYGDETIWNDSNTLNGVNDEGRNDLPLDKVGLQCLMQ